MYNTKTNTSTFTITDIRKTFENCEADIRMIARRTGKWTMEYVDKIFHDILILAENKYIKSVDIVLLNSSGKVIKATKFEVNENGIANSSDRAGKNDWEDIAETKLSIILSYTPNWKSLPTSNQAKFVLENKFKIGWVSSSIDNSFPHLKNSQAQLYSSKGYELQKTTYNS